MTITKDQYIEVYIYESIQLVETLEEIILRLERTETFDKESIHEIFRIMHTVKGSSSMMGYGQIAAFAHLLEDLFDIMRSSKSVKVDFSLITDYVLKFIDFIKNELEKIENGKEPDGQMGKLGEKVEKLVQKLKSKHHKKQAENESSHGKSKASQNNEVREHIYHTTVYFEAGCEMEGVRAFGLRHHLEDVAEIIDTVPKNIEDYDAAEYIRDNGFTITFRAGENLESIHEVIKKTVSLERYEINRDELKADEDEIAEVPEGGEEGQEKEDLPKGLPRQSMISVPIDKLDFLMDIVGELVISQAMLLRNPGLKGQELKEFVKLGRHHKRITNDLQDVIMSIRLLPISIVFNKMRRIIRDMGNKLQKEIVFEVVGEEVEVDKNVIEKISDPIMHLIRNSLDHGIEDPETRMLAGKDPAGKLVVEAKNTGGEVWIVIRDDGKGLDQKKIYDKAFASGLTTKPMAELTDKEIFSFILLPGFSTKEVVSEYSGRGVGMDVVVQNIREIGGKVFIDSTPGAGTAISIKIPLTLAIIQGIDIAVGESRFTLPIENVKESFRVKHEQVINDGEGNELILVRGVCYPLLRLHKKYKLETSVGDLKSGIIILVESDSQSFAIFADRILGSSRLWSSPSRRIFKRKTAYAAVPLTGTAVSV